MDYVSPQIARRLDWRRGFGLTILTLATLYLIWVAAKGFGAAMNQEDFPEALAIKMEALPLIFPLHMVTGALTLLAVPATYLLRRTRAHRWAGGMTAALVVVAGLTAIPVAWIAPVTPWSGAGFMAQGIAWLTTLGLGLNALWKRRYAHHRYYMLLMAAITSGAAFFRLWLGLFAMGGSYRHYHLFYSLDSWFGWLLPLGVAIIVLKKPHLR